MKPAQELGPEVSEGDMDMLGRECPSSAPGLGCAGLRLNEAPAAG